MLSAIISIDHPSLHSIAMRGAIRDAPFGTFNIASTSEVAPFIRRAPRQSTAEPEIQLELSAIA
jgi:hypothetical protein